MTATLTAPRYVMYENSPDGFVCYGAAAEFWEYRGHEAVLSGPYESGKTLAILHKLHALLSKYPKARGLMLRKTYKSLVGSAVVTYEHKVLPKPPGDPLCPVTRFGGEKPEFYDYPNGSRLLLGGMDNADKFLSAEFDFIYVNQAEELELDDWEKLTGRATGRAGNTPYAQVMGDCNPSYPTHWIKQRASLTLMNSRHEDNPTLYDRDGHITERGKRTMAVLDALTGVRYKRGRLGLWVGAEGQVYEEWDDTVHLIDHFDPPADWLRFRAIDFGFTNAFVCSWYAVDGDGRMFRYRELYQTQRLVEDLAGEIKRLSEGERISYTVADHDAEDRATLAKHGIPTIPANKAVKTGIEAVQKRLRKAGDGKPRLFLMRDASVVTDSALVDRRKPTSTEQEIPGYIWEPQREGRAAKEEPVKVDDHGVDQLRYAVMSQDGGNGPKIQHGLAAGLYPSQSNGNGQRSRGRGARTKAMPRN
jgi:phage terminase large subunit